MANTISVPYTISDDRTTITVSDTTVYTNPIRTDVAVFLSVKKVDYKGREVVVETTPDNPDPEVAAAWTAPYDKDGHYRFKYVAVPEYSGATSYNLYDAVYDTVGGLVYRSIQAANIGNALNDTAWWSIISDPTTIVDYKDTVLESNNVDASGVNNILYLLTQDKRDRFAVDASTACFGDFTTRKEVDEFSLIDILLEGLKAADTFNEYNKGELIARKAESL